MQVIARHEIARDTGFAQIRVLRFVDITRSKPSWIEYEITTPNSTFVCTPDTLECLREAIEHARQR